MVLEVVDGGRGAVSAFAPSDHTNYWCPFGAPLFAFGEPTSRARIVRRFPRRLRRARRRWVSDA